MVNRSQHNSWKKKQSKSHSNPSQNSWKQRKSVAPVEPVPKHRSIRCMAEGPMPCRSIFSGWRQESSKAPVEPMVKKISTGAMKVFCSREHVLVDLNSSSAPVEPTLHKQNTGALNVLCSRELVWVDQWTSSAPVEPMCHRTVQIIPIKCTNQPFNLILRYCTPPVHPDCLL